ncbi:hypothetical protein D3C87_755230 [compost metagenome]
MNTEDYRSPPVHPTGKDKDSNRKLSRRRNYNAGEILMTIHNYLPYRMTLAELGITESATVHDDPSGPPGNGRFERRARLKEFLENTGKEIIIDHESSGHQRYEFVPDGTWGIMINWVYLKDPKLLSVLKLAFG